MTLTEIAHSVLLISVVFCRKMNAFLGKRPVFRLFSFLYLCIYAASPVSVAYGGRAGSAHVCRPSSTANINEFFCEFICSKITKNHRVHDVAFCNKKRAVAEGCLINDPLLGRGMPGEHVPERLAYFKGCSGSNARCYFSIHPIHSPPSGPIWQA